MQAAGVGQHDDSGDSATKAPGASPFAGFLAPVASPTTLARLLGLAGKVAPILPWAGAGAILLTPTNASCQQGATTVAGHPELGARWERGTGAFNGTATLYAWGPDGQQTGAGRKLDMDPDGRLTGQRGTPFEGITFGTLPRDPSGGVQLAPGLEATLAGHVAPQAGSSPVDLPVHAQPEPQVGIGYEARTPEEAERAAEMQAQGKNGNDIAAELDRMRSNAGVATTGGTGKGGAEGSKAATVPTPRNGVVGGTPVGARKPMPPRASQTEKEGLRLEAESEEAMAAAGYQVERRPTVRGEDDIKDGKVPDTRLAACRS